MRIERRGSGGVAWIAVCVKHRAVVAAAGGTTGSDIEHPSLEQWVGEVECAGQHGWAGAAMLRAARQTKAALQPINATSAIATMARFRTGALGSTRRQKMHAVGRSRSC